MRTKLIITIGALLIILGTVKAQNTVDKLGPLRTSKKIISVNSLPGHDDYAIQIIALMYPAGEPEFFKNIDEAREFECSDGYVRYCVGSYNTFSEAKEDLDKYKDLGYVQSFVVNTNKLALKGSSNKGIIPDPNKTYTIQLSAYRFPVYISHFKGVDHVMEFYMKDKIFRYTTGEYKYDEAVAELQEIKQLGYKGAFVTELDAYLPYKIE